MAGLQIVCRKWYDKKIPAYIRSINCLTADKEFDGFLMDAANAMEKAGPLTWRMMQAETMNHGMEPVRISPKTHKA